MVPDPHLMESMRAVGYTLETAIADLVDNSITAGASHVDILFTGATDSYVAVIDNGKGMSALEAQNAMRLAGNSSRNSRETHDLGRFGLGLKTASISQCRNLTVVTKKGGQIYCYRWDLDYLASSGTWSLLHLDADEYSSLPEFDVLNELDSGTMVLWRNLDQLKATHGTLESSMDESMVAVRRHLGLVFHRYLAGEHGKPFTISINYRKIEGADPLLKKHKATQAGASDRISLPEGVIELRPYTLPHLNKLTSKDKERARIDGSLRDSQGFYIYRQMRLVIWGTWFRIAPKQELGKLARVQVDVPNSLDHLWSLDIKKAQAVPPPIIRTRLRQVADSIIAPSRNVHTYRGRAAEKSQATHLWKVIEDRDAFRYEINREHPAVAALLSNVPDGQLTALSSLLNILEGSFPVDDVYNRLGQDFSHRPTSLDNQELKALAADLWGSLKSSMSPEIFISAMRETEPFSSDQHAVIYLEKAVHNG
ncbi:ATP-binding protein [Arthrobacter caoxuetaonis]|uniref:ATP-binding protein n=1 Tax=Arthrobacter caoxuetaonis TaxID=2886935 RepID=UPI001D1564DD|nr:ATP-binding protein [Arthrobacter caoxuetaonis]MCC3282074.1 ATP-binding protein [Arthrobacter caoxuetaonis]